MQQRALISVVDDDVSSRESLPDLLQMLGFASVAFASAEDFLASDLLADTRCLILDVSMPGMSGPQLQSELSRRELNIPIVFITAHGDLFDEIALYRVTKTGINGNADGALVGDFDGRLDDVFIPITVAGRNISRQGEARQRRHSNVMGPADSGFEHSATPHRDATLEAGGLHQFRFGMSADAAEFKVDNAARFQFDGGDSVSRVVDAFVQAYGGFYLRLKFAMGVDIVPTQRLLHHKQIEIIKSFKMGDVVEAICRIRVHRQADVGELFADGGHEVIVLAGFNFQLDALVAAAKFFLDSLQQRLRIFSYAQRDTSSNFIPRAA